jgi:hypothetical protein
LPYHPQALYHLQLFGQKATKQNNKNSEKITTRFFGTYAYGYGKEKDVSFQASKLS